MKSTPTPSAHMKGGNSAASHAIAVFGNASEQVANTLKGNEIAMRPVLGGKRRANRKSGGTMVVDLGVPAALFAVQQYTKPSSKKTKRGGSRKKKHSKTKRNRKH